MVRILSWLALASVGTAVLAALADPILDATKNALVALAGMGLAFLVLVFGTLGPVGGMLLLIAPTLLGRGEVKQ